MSCTSFVPFSFSRLGPCRRRHAASEVPNNKKGKTWEAACTHVIALNDCGLLNLFLKGEKGGGEKKGRNGVGRVLAQRRMTATTNTMMMMMMMTGTTMSSYICRETN